MAKHKWLIVSIFNLVKDRIRELIHPTPTPKTHERRMCSECGFPIKRTHKFFYFEDGTRHKNCDDPSLSQPFLPMGAENDTPAQADQENAVEAQHEANQVATEQA